MFSEADTQFTYPSCFKTTCRGNLSIAGSGQKRRARKAQQTPALEFHKGAGEKSVPHIRFSKQYFEITFLCLHSFKEEEEKYLLDSNVEANYSAFSVM